MDSKNFLYTTFVFIALVLTVSAVSAQSKAPKTVRDYFMLLPGKYFSLDCCGGRSTREAKKKYLKQYLDVEDTANGYMKGYGAARRRPLKWPCSSARTAHT